MVHIVFDPSSVGYATDNFVYIKQRGGGGEGEDIPIINGSGDEDRHKTPMHFFRGSAPFQRGYGFRFVARGNNNNRLATRYYNQRGSGIGDILRGLWRLIFPVLRKAGQTIGREGISTGERILEKVAHGEPIKESVVTEGKRGIDNLLASQGIPKQFGTGRKRRREKGKKTVRFNLPSHQTLIGREVVKKLPPTTDIDKSFTPKTRKKRIRSDTFGFY